MAYKPQHAPIVDTLANIEAITPELGQEGLPSDSQYQLRCYVAGTWSYLSRGSRVAKPPTSGWSSLNSGSVSVAGGMRVLSLPATAGVVYRGEGRDLPSTPFYMIARHYTTGHDGEQTVGIRDSTSGKMIVHTLHNTGGSLQKYNSFTAWAGHYYTTTFDPWPHWPWFAIHDDGTDTHHYTSQDRLTWTLLHTRGRTDHVAAPDQLWWGAYINNASFPAVVILDDWEEGSGALPTTLP